MCNAQETWKKPTVKGSDAFRPVYRPRGVECVQVSRFIPRLSLNGMNVRSEEVSEVSRMETHHEPCLNDPQRVRGRRARGPGNHRGHYMQPPRVFPSHRLVAFWLSGRIYRPLLPSVVHLDHGGPKFRCGWSWGVLNPKWNFPKGGFYAVVNREIDGPRRQVA